MFYSHEREEAGEYLRLALNFMMEHQITTVPVHYCVVYEHVSGHNQKLTAVMNELIRKSVSITPEILKQLYGNYVTGKGTSETANLAIHDIKKIMSDLMGTMSSAEGELEDSNNALLECINDASSQTLNSGMQSILNALVSVTKEIIGSSEDMKSRLNHATREVETLRDKLKKTRIEALTDTLTGLTNRRGMEKILQQEIRETRKSGQDLSVIMGDIDHFKNINDTFGHLVGDHVIKMVATTLKGYVRGRDHVVRYGGEEFMILLPETSLDGALVLGEKIRDFLASMSWKENQKGTSLGKITLSFGISCLSEKDTTDSLIKRADDALYHSKQNGRNRVTPENMLAN